MEVTAFMSDYQKKKKKKQLSWVRIDSHNLKKDPRWVFYLINNILSFVLVLYN